MLYERPIGPVLTIVGGAEAIITPSYIPTLLSVKMFSLFLHLAIDLYQTLFRF